MTRRLAAATLLALALLAPAAAGAAEGERIIVAREPGLSAAERSAVRDAADARLLKALPLPGVEVVEVPAGRGDEALAKLNASPDVRYAERDGRVRAFVDPETGYGQQRIAAPQAWPLTTGGGVTVAVVDTGISSTHPDLRNRIAANPREIPLNRVDDDGNGFVDDVRGWNFVSGNNAADDLNGHGSFVSGIIAAEDGNGGVSGTAPDARVLPLKALDADGSGFNSDVVSALDYAGRMGIRVANASLGGPTQSDTLDAVINRYPQTLYVVAAGNENADNDRFSSYPCNTRAVNLLCVGATDGNDQRAFFSNYGRRTVDVMAPGVDIVSTDVIPPNSYDVGDGTSFSAPFVSGIAALVIARGAGATSAAVKSAVFAGVDPVAGLAGITVSGGRANALRSLTVAPVDTDADGVSDVWDVCRSASDPGQEDLDDDGVGDACDDSDADGIIDARDNCRDVSAPGSLDGCPATLDGDGDGVVNARDRCPTLPAPGVADGCPLPVALSSDRDGDGRPDASDRCPDQPAATPSGCVVPSVRSLSVRAIGGRRRLSVRVRLDQPSTITVTVQRRLCRGGRCRFETVASRRVTLRRSSATLTVTRAGRRRFARGRYRLRLSAQVATERSRTATRSFRVR